MKKTPIAVLGLAAAFCLAAYADEPISTAAEHLWYQPGETSYKANEWTFDAAGVVSSRNIEDFSTRNSLGIGLGVNYFFTKYFGAGADTYIDHFDWPNHLSLNLLARYPIPQTGIAPYAIGGFARQFHDVGQWSGDIGAGVEMRWNQGVGVFFDAREVFAATTRDYSIWRLGLRFGF